ncbi:MAG: gliding motility-associated C-terminal domain-containing protein, partial [Flammeovirgaceae bacterium]
GQAIQITGTFTDPIDEFQWTILNMNGEIINFIPYGSTSTFSQTFPTAGTYKIIMELRNRCGLNYSNAPGKDLVIDASPNMPKITVPNCISFPVTLIGNAASPIWSTGETSPTITLLGNGQVTLTDVNAAGCKSTSNAVIIKESIPLTLQNQIVCEGDKRTIDTSPLTTANYTFDWSLNGVVQPALQNKSIIDIDTSTPTQLPSTPPLTYSVKVTGNASRCETTKSMTVTINTKPQLEFKKVSDPLDCGGNGSVSFQIKPPTVPAGPYFYNLTGPFFPPNPSNASGSDQTVPFELITLPGKAGIYDALVTDQLSGCTARNSVNLSDPGFDIDATPNCESVQISSSEAVSQFTLYNVSTGAIERGPIPIIPSLNSFTIANLTGGASYLVEVKGGSCTATKPFITLSQPQVNITQNCRTLSATTGLRSYLWTSNIPGTIVGPTNGSSIEMQRPTNGDVVIYTLKATALGITCPNVQEITVNVPQNLSVDFTTTPPNGCVSSVSLTASVSPSTNVISYNWYNGSNVFLGSTPNITVTTSDSYKIEVLDFFGCSYTKSNNVAVNGLVDVQILPSPPACDNGKPTMLTTITSASAVQYRWFFNDSSTPISGQDKSNIEVTQEGKYTITVSKGNCSASDSRTVSRFPIPQGSLLDAVLICNDRDNDDPSTNQVELNPGQHNSYNWFYKADKESSKVPLNDTDQKYIAKDPGIFLVDITNIFGCTSSDQTEVLNECNPKIVGPNAFRPNSSAPDYSSKFGTNSNKEFFVYSYFVTDNFEILIYNRWGELVFQSTDRSFKWNGGYNNNASQPLPGGTYTYVVRYQSSFRPQDGVREQRGGVVLLR